MDTTSVIEVNNLRKNFKGFELSIDNLEIPEGFATALIGENGAGKSTFINILAGIRRDYKGEVKFYDGSLDERELRERIGYTGTDCYFLPHWTVGDVETVSGILFDGFHDDIYRKLLDDMNITERNKAFSKLSDGMKMKTILSAVFARNTRLLLLDEPASPLDPLMRDKLCSMIREYIDEGNGEKSVLFSTHNIADMENVTDYAVIIEQGRVVEQGFVEDLKEKYVMVKGELVEGDAENGSTSSGGSSKGAIDTTKSRDRNLNEDTERNSVNSLENIDIEKDRNGMNIRIIAEQTLYGCTFSQYGFEGLCLSESLKKFAGMDIAVETPTLSQICVGIMKKYTVLK